MKKLQIIAWTLFMIGLAFRLLHFPGANVASILGTLLLVIYSVMYLTKNAKSNLLNSLLHLSYSLITTYILFRLLYWYCGPMILGVSLFFIIVSFVTISWFILQLVSKTAFKFPQIFLVVSFAFSFILSFIHSDRIHYFLHLNQSFYNESRNTDYRAWDKYSWFLYIVDKQDEAIEANRAAQKAAEEYLKITSDGEAAHYLTIIKQHEQQIQEKSWTTYP